MKKIQIEKKWLEINVNGEMYTVEYHNGSGLFTLLDENKNELFLTSDEVKKNGGNAAQIYDTLEMLGYTDGRQYYTDDDINFIDQWELDHMPEEFKPDFEPVEFEVV